MEYLIELYEKWIETPRWQKWLAIMALGVVCFVALYYYTVVPMKEELLMKKKKLDSLVLSVNKLKTIERRKNKVQRAIHRLERKIAEIEKSLPTGREDVAEIVETIEKADSGVVVTKIERKPPKQKKYYVEYPYEVYLLASYPSFIRWCERLIASGRLIAFGGIDIVTLSPATLKSEKGVRTAVLQKLMSGSRLPFNASDLLRQISVGKAEEKGTGNSNYTIAVRLVIRAFALR